MHNRLSLLFAAASAAFMIGLAGTNVHGAAEDFTETAPSASENGIITLDNGQQWYKATELEDDRNYLITASRSDGSTVMLTADDNITAEYIWHYAESKMVTSTSPHYNELFTDTHRLCCYDDDLFLTKNWWTTGDQTWNFDGSRLFYNDDGKLTYLTYSESSPVHFGCTDDISKAADINIYTTGAELARCIKTQPCAESFVIEGSGYAAPVFSFELMNDSIVTDSVHWFVDGEKTECTDLSFTADQLRDLPAGVHRVSCTVRAHDSDWHYYRETSQEAIFVITKGVVPDSFITFSDVHEQYDLIGKAIEDVLDRTGGYIPSLVVCTGDFINGPTMDNDTMLNRYIPWLKPYLGGLDTVFVAGNHDSSSAVSQTTLAAGLGADDGFSEGCGVIFRGSSDKVTANGKNSTAAKDIIVYGINYASINKETYNATVQDYNMIKDRIDAFLAETAKNYHGELIVFSAHAGLHVLGVQPESLNLAGYTVGSWIGANAYNIDHSCDLAGLINSYAEKYGMNIIYLFGHDHSRGEMEFILTDGDTLVSPNESAYKLYKELPLSFTYAHAGYLSTVIGAADAHFSFIYRNGDELVYELFQAGSSEYTERTAIPLKNRISHSESKAAASEKTDGNSPKTSGRSKITPLFIISLAALLISRKHRK